ncbi:MAG: trigger factor [Oscillospiraceae bacterium]
MSLIAHKKTDDGKYELKITIDADAFAKAIDKVYHRENKKISIQGFRKGKAPRAIIERMYGDSFFFEDAINELLPDEFESAIKEADIEMIGRPEVDVTEMSKEKGAEVTFVVELRPELTVKKYKGIVSTKTVNTVDDEDISAELKKLQEKGSSIVSVEGRAAELGDIANIDFEGFKDDVAFEGGKGEKFDLTLGSGQFIPGFEDKVVGHNIGDEFDVNLTFPEEYGAEDLAGKAVVFKVKLNDLHVKKYPELDDEFAKDVSEFDSLDELKADIKTKLEKLNADSATSQLENNLLDEVVSSVEGTVPAVMIEEKIEEMIRDFDYRLQQQGMDMKTYMKYMGGNIETFREQFRENAEKQIKSRLALEAVARAEKIEATEADIEAEYKKFAEIYKMEVEKLKQVLPLKELVGDIKVNKAIDVIKDSAKVKEEFMKKVDEAKETAKKAASKAKKAVKAAVDAAEAVIEEN